MTVARARKWILNGSTPGPSKSLSHTLLIENGFIHQAGKGLFSLLPLGQRVVDKLNKIIDEELQKTGALKLTMPLIGTKNLWDKTGRWELMDTELMKFEDRHGAAHCLQPTAEEMCTDIVSSLGSFKKHHFPLIMYQTSEKFRDEMNPRFGLLRARQFLMKDAYSFDIDSESALATYKKMCKAYDRIFGDRLNLPFYKVEAESGVHGGNLSHEYHLTSPLEEDFVNICTSCRKVTKTTGICDHCGGTTDGHSTVEVAHTFHLGTKYSEALKAKFNGTSLDMGCYGIGVTRLLPAAIDVMTVSKNALRLPRAIAPFEVVVIPKKSLIDNVLTELVVTTSQRYLTGGVLLDDRVELPAGKRIKDANRLGIPLVVVLANETEKSLTKTPMVEVFTSDPKTDDLTKHGMFTLEQFAASVQTHPFNLPSITEGLGPPRHPFAIENEQ